MDKFKQFSHAIVLNLHYSGVGIARDLATNNIRVLGLGFEPRALGRYSRHLSYRNAPDSDRNPLELLAYLKNIANDIECPAVLFPTRDADLLFMDRYRKELEVNYRLVIPEQEILLKIMDKYTLSKEAIKTGVSTPKTTIASSLGDLRVVASDFSFPLVVKPRRAVDWRKPGIQEATGRRKAFLATTCDKLFSFYENIAFWQPEVIVQEWVQGEENNFFIFGCYMGKKHDCVGSVVFRKWLQYPPDFGLGCLVESIVDSDVREAGLRLLRGMDYSGFAEVEFKRDGKTNELKLIEINPRPWDQHSLATRCGVNLSHAAYLDALGLKIPEYQYKNGGYWIASENLVRRIVNDVTSGRKVDLHLLWRVITGKKHYSLFSIYDPVPGLIGLFILIKDILSWIGRKLFRLR